MKCNSIRWVIAILLSFSLILPNAGNVLAEEIQTQDISIDSAGNIVAANTTTVNKGQEALENLPFNPDEKPYIIELERFEIRNTIAEDNETAIKTTTGINAALQYAKEQGYTKIIFPQGTYSIGVNLTPGLNDQVEKNTPVEIDLKNVVIDLNGSTLRIIPSGSNNYSIVDFMDGAENCALINGIVQGDRYDHTYPESEGDGNLHEACHGIVLKGGNNLIINNMTIKDLPGYGVNTEIGSGIRDERRYHRLTPKDTENGSIDDNGSNIDNPAATRTRMYDFRVRDIQSNNPLTLLEAGMRFQLGYAMGYYGYPTLKSEWYTSYFYDENMNFIEKKECKQYKNIDIPENAIFVRFVFPQDSIVDTNPNGFAQVFNYTPPTNVFLTNCNMLNNRCLGLAVCGGQYMTIDSNFFDGNGEKGAAYAVDFEDGWELMYDIYFTNNKFVNSPKSRDLAVCAGDRIWIEGNEFTGTATVLKRTTNYTFKNNKVTGGVINTITGVASIAGASLGINRENCEISGNTYINCGTVSGVSYSDLDITFENDTFVDSVIRAKFRHVNNVPVPGDICTKLVNCSFTRPTKVSNFNEIEYVEMENCTIQSYSGDIRNSILKNCTITDAKMGLIAQTSFEGCTITDSAFKTANYRAMDTSFPQNPNNMTFKGCTITNGQIEYYVYAISANLSDITVDDCDITVSQRPLMKLSPGTKNLIFRNNTVENQSTFPVFEAFTVPDYVAIPDCNILIEGNSFNFTNHKYVFDGTNITKGVLKYTGRNNTITGAAEAQMLNPQYIGNPYFVIIANEPAEPEPTEPVTTLTGSDTAAKSEQIELVLGLAGVEGITAQDICISYDKSKFELVDVVPVVYGTTKIESENKPEEGTIRLILASYAISGNVVVFKLRFNTKVSGIGIISVTKAELGNGDGDIISAKLSNKNILIEGKMSDLLAAIASAKEVLNNAVEGFETGMYPEGTKARLNSAIVKAEEVSGNILPAEEIAQAIEELNLAVNLFRSYAITSETGDFNEIPGLDIGDIGIASCNYGMIAGEEGWDAVKRVDINGDGEIGLYELAFIAKKLLGN